MVTTPKKNNNNNNSIGNNSHKKTMVTTTASIISLTTSYTFPGNTQFSVTPHYVSNMISEYAKYI